MVAACKASPNAQPPAATDNAAQAKPPQRADETQRRSAESAAAAEVLTRYYEAIEAHDYGTAYALWGDGGQASRHTFEEFKAGFADTRSTALTIAQLGDVEGAAGSLYVSIPVTVHAELNDGASQQFSGSYVLRRVNDVEGSTPEQRSWHIYSASLRPSK